MVPGRLTAQEMQRVIMDEFGVADSDNLSIAVLADSAHTFSHIKWKMNAFLVEITSEKPSPTALIVSESTATGGFVSSEEMKLMTFSAAMNTYRSIAVSRLSGSFEYEGVPVTDTPAV
jgi:adenine-specific DNA glycosylase